MSNSETESNILEPEDLERLSGLISNWGLDVVYNGERFLANALPIREGVFLLCVSPRAPGSKVLPNGLARSINGSEVEAPVIDTEVGSVSDVKAFLNGYQIVGPVVVNIK